MKTPSKEQITELLIRTLSVETKVIRSIQIPYIENESIGEAADAILKLLQEKEAGKPASPEVDYLTFEPVKPQQGDVVESLTRFIDEEEIPFKNGSFVMYVDGAEKYRSLNEVYKSEQFKQWKDKHP